MSLPVYYSHQIEITLTNTSASPVLLTGIPTNTLLHGISLENTEGSPDGLCTISCYDSIQAYIGQATIADMGTTDIAVTRFDNGLPALGGIYYEATGDADSNTQVVKTTFFLQVLA